MDSEIKKNPSTAPTKEHVEGAEKGKTSSSFPKLYQIKYDLSTPKLNFCPTPGIVDQKCVKCGKNFIRTYPKYAWKDCCSYTCYLHRDDNKEVPHSKPVDMFTQDGGFIKSFSNSIEAAKYVGLMKPDSIRNCCLGKTKTSAGFVWRYKEVKQND